MQPVPSVACVSAPVEELRAKVSTALLPGAATYTFAPSGLTVTPSGSPRARAVVQPVVGVSTRQPVVSEG